MDCGKYIRQECKKDQCTEAWYSFRFSDQEKVLKEYLECESNEGHCPGCDLEVLLRLNKNLFVKLLEEGILQIHEEKLFTKHKQELEFCICMFSQKADVGLFAEFHRRKLTPKRQCCVCKYFEQEKEELWFEFYKI